MHEKLEATSRNIDADVKKIHYFLLCLFVKTKCKPLNTVHSNVWLPADFIQCRKMKLWRIKPL